MILPKLLLGFSLMAFCVTIHAMGLIALFQWMDTRLERNTRNFRSSTWLLVRIAAWTLSLHLLQILSWAVVYARNDAIPDFTTAAYFSAVTYTTTGYGDIVLPPEWRLVGGIEALTGILMCGVSTGMFFATFSKIIQFGPAREPTT